MSFGRRLALFFLLLVIVPMLALISILLFVSEDARQGKADARLAAGLETALAVYGERLADGRAAARDLADTPGLGEAIAAGDRSALTDAARDQLTDGATAVEIEGAARTLLLRVGRKQAAAFGAVRLQRGSTPLGVIRVSTTTASAFADDVKRLTRRELLVTRADVPIASTVTAPDSLPEAGETADLELAEGEYRGRRQLLDPASNESVLLLGPRKEGSALAVGRPAAALLVAFLLLAGIFAFTLARELTRLHERVAAQAASDPLTGLWNRRQMDDLMAKEDERRRRYDREYSLLIVDIDEFKSINDRYGHPQGDAVLERLAEIIRRETRTIDSGIRYGGDEFALILAETGASGAVVAAERVRRSVERAVFPLRNGELKTTISIGVATAPENATEAEELIEAADGALLTAKREGKNRVVSAIRHA